MKLRAIFILGMIKAMDLETKLCQNCRRNFTIESEDFNFYKKIDVPPPTWCPMCRRERLLSWRNERTLYKRKCAATGKDIVSIFSPDGPINAYERDYWWSDAWDARQFGMEYDFSIPFFTQFRKLMERVPMPSVFNSTCVNSNYCNHVAKSKDCYFVFASFQNENLVYSSQCGDVRDSSDILTANSSELCYEVIKGMKLYHVLFAENSENCNDCAFIYDCKGCQQCFGCTNLRNKSYYFFNTPCTKEEYQEKIKEFDLGKRSDIKRAWTLFEAEKLKAIRRPAFFVNTTNSTGDYLDQCDSCKYCFGIRMGGRNCKYCMNGGYTLNDSYDTFGCGDNGELIYESVDAGLSGSRFLFDVVAYGGTNVEYSLNCHGSENLFGCIGLRNKRYCILNKEYTKEEYEILIPKIKAHMKEIPYIDTKGRTYSYGEFFPTELSLFAYNESLAYEHFPYTKEVIERRGYPWRDLPKNEYAITVHTENIPESIADVFEDITKEVLECGHKRTCLDNCVGAFRITPQEFSLYKKIGVSLPELCPNCRHMERIKRANPFFLWKRNCGKCGVSMETTYAPERPEIVYCEACYQAEIV